MDLPQIDGAAPADTALGLLERGRGAGWIGAARSESGQDLLLACLTREPRWDRQVESRADYYATLALQLGLPISALTPHRVDEDEPCILIEVLEAMARRGSTGAAEVLGSFGHSDPSASGPPVMQAARPRLARTPPLDADASIEDLLAESRPPFRKAVLHRLRITTYPNEVSALREASLRIDHPGWRFALQVLGARGDTTPLDVIEQVLASDESGSIRAAAFQYMRALPADTTLPLARAWITHDDGRGAIASVVLASHAELPDAPAVRAALAAATDYYTVSSLVEALGRLPEAGPFCELEEVYVQSAYSYARARAVDAMAVTDPDFEQKWAAECLWDAEEAVRVQGARLAPREAAARERLQQLADDPHEDPDVRQAARSRLR